MPDQTSESPKVQYIYGGRGGRGGEMGGSGGLGGGPTWEYGISAQTITLVNHWHLSSAAPPDNILNTDLDERDCPDRQPPVEQSTAGLGPYQVRSQYNGGGAGGQRINDHVLVLMPVRKATFDSLIHERLAADQTRSNFHLPPNDTTIPMPIPAPSVDDPILADRAADHTPPPFPLSPAPPDDAVPAMPVRKPTFDSLVLERLVADHAHPTFPLAPDDATIHITMPIPTPSVDSPILERRVADHAPPPLPVRKPTFDSLILERLAAEHTHPTLPLAPDDYAHHSFPLPPAPPTFPPELGHALTPPPLILSTRPHRSLFQRLRLRKKPKPCLSTALSSVME